MSVADELQEIFDKMPEAFVPEKAANIEAVIQLDLSGDGGGQWAVKIVDGGVSIDAGSAGSPNLTLSMAVSDYVALSRGEVDPMNLFMAGKIKLQGDMGLALKFQELFERG